MSDSEEDYMSDAFLAKCQDTRPGLVSGRATKIHKKEVKIKEINHKNNTKPRKVLEAESRDEGLNKAIGQDNKGFALLQKMGYKPGMAMGKKGTGRVEPIPINVRLGRGGLGEESHRKRKKQEMAEMRAAMMLKRQKREATYQADYRAERSKQMAARQTDRDLYNSQRVCEQLDEEQGYEEPLRLYYWTAMKLKAQKEIREKDTADEAGEGFHNEVAESEDEEGQDDDLEEEEEDCLDPAEKLVELTEYLRSTYLYCVWCGTRYEDEDDLTKNCPGNTAEAHDS